MKEVGHMVVAADYQGCIKVYVNSEQLWPIFCSEIKVDRFKLFNGSNYNSTHIIFVCLLTHLFVCSFQPQGTKCSIMIIYNFFLINELQFYELVESVVFGMFQV